MEERSKGRLCLKLGQRKLFFQQKLQTGSKPPEESSETRPESAPITYSETNSAKDEQGTSATTRVRETPPLSGLCNLGNTCYVNSLLQPLRFCPQFCQWVGELHHLCEQLVLQSCVNGAQQTDVIQPGIDTTNNHLLSNGELAAEGDAMECSEPHPREEEERPSVALVTHLHNLWQRMRQKEKTVVKPTNKVTILSATKPDSFIAKLKEENPLFDNKMQQDAQEMLRFMLTNLQETFATATKSSTSLQLHHPLGGSEPRPHVEVIDVDSYCSGSTQLPASRKRKMPFIDSQASKPIKAIKLNKRVTNKKVTEYFSPLKGKSKCVQNNCKQKSIPQKTDNKSSVIDFITDCFQGQVAYQMRCYECDSYTRRTEPFLDVSVPVTNSADILPGFPSGASPRKPAAVCGSSLDVGPYSLSWALSQFALREKLRGDNKYFCDECGHFVEAERSVLFSHLSSVMTIHLNRFATHTWSFSSTVTVNKVGGNLAVPLSLSFKPWCTNDCTGRDRVYQLFAVVFHSGSSCSSGHYTACVRGRECKQLAPQEAKERFDDSGWIYFDDDQLDYINQSELLEMMSPLSNNASTAYILFYTCNL